ncbi:MAG: hypothetical protein M3Y80_05270 [Verrucomicrobiota bacterium]|nr:hypothetical protein [Verrucomicrobiota bacterium]
MQIPPLTDKACASLLAAGLCLTALAGCQTQTAIAADQPSTPEAAYTVSFTYIAPKDASPGQAERFQKVLQKHQEKLVGEVVSNGRVLLKKDHFDHIATTGVTQGAKVTQPIDARTATSKVQQIDGALGFQNEADLQSFMADLASGRRSGGKH